LAGFLWLIADAYQEDEVRARYRLASSRASWDFDVWVRPEERLGWVFRRLWEAARQHLRARGVRWTCSRISAFNAASLRAHAQIGTVTLGHAVFLRCGAWQWMIATLRPWFHLSRSPSSFPQLTFDIPVQEPPCPTSTK
jgi:GNAT superfamily N-acetyltransferase